MECIGKGKPRMPYELGVKVSLAVTHRHGLLFRARSFPGNPNGGHMRSKQLERTNNLLQHIGVVPSTLVVDLGFRGVDEACAPMLLIHPGKFKSLDAQQRKTRRELRSWSPPSAVAAQRPS